jgi:ABC-type nitrate/sulfonate/bicarbonate transport system substrate-binding protein
MSTNLDSSKHSSEDPTVDVGTTITRRTALRNFAATGVAIAAPGLFTATAKASRTASAKAASAAYAIPSKTVRLGVAPFPDASIYVIGQRAGWFKDVGITIEPSPPQVLVNNQTIPALINGQVDMAAQYGPDQLTTMTKAPKVKMVSFSDAYIGIYILAAPHSGAKTVAELRKSGLSFSAAMQKAMAQLKGKPVGLNNEGDHQSFYHICFKLGGVSPSQLDLSVIDDVRMVQLALGGHLGFCSPGGAAQNVELLHAGWYPIVSVTDLIDGLPLGDPRAVGTVGHEGLATTTEFLSSEHDTVLRMVSVMFRIVDAIKKSPLPTLQLESPFISTAAATPTSAKSLAQVFQVINPVIPFEDQKSVWLEPKAPLFYANIYNPQIKELQAAGTLPKGHLTASQTFAGPQIYEELVALRKKYDRLLPKAKGLSGAAKKMATAAATQYANRNYLDASSMLAAAVS